MLRAVAPQPSPHCWPSRIIPMFRTFLNSFACRLCTHFPLPRTTCLYFFIYNGIASVRSPKFVPPILICLCRCVTCCGAFTLSSAGDRATVSIGFFNRKSDLLRVTAWFSSTLTSKSGSWLPMQQCIEAVPQNNMLSDAAAYLMSHILWMEPIFMQ